jgi:type IV pilus assembly protein PilB
MSGPKKRLGELLIQRKLITPEQLEQALAFQRDKPAPLGSALINLGFITEDILLNALAAHLGVRPWRIDQLPPEPEAIGKLPGETCRECQLIPVAISGDLLVVAMVNPHDLDAIDLVRYSTRMRVEPVLVDVQRLMHALDRYYGPSLKSSEDLDNLVELALKDFNVDSSAKNDSEAITEAETAPVIGLVNQILSDAIRMRASDIHVEPRNDRVDIRYRIDGELQKVREVPISLHPMVTARMKIMGEMDLVEFRIPQDGRISVIIDGRTVDLRVSILPSQHGGRIVLRILDKATNLKKMDDMGFTEKNLNIFRSLIQKPYGIFLVTGPTGSGKTTTLYAALNELHDITTNIMTCEDPIEYELDGINQSQVNEKVGLTFAKQLRAILRQDPDVVLVGEIRDTETAETAIRAALTGHMVLSTLHCNDAPAAIPRLLDMGIDSFLLSSALIGVMAQRLARTLCKNCRKEVPIKPEQAAMYEAFGLQAPEHLWEGEGCAACGRSGFKGRRGVHEILPVTPPISKLIAARQSIETITELSFTYGYRPMQYQALDMAREGQTTLDEAARVVFLDVNYAGNKIIPKGLNVEAA